MRRSDDVAKACNVKSFGINPKNGGSPPKDKRSAVKSSLRVRFS